jgi:hypothetical protein
VAPCQSKFQCKSKIPCPTPLFSFSPTLPRRYLLKMRLCPNITRNSAPHEHHFSEERPMHKQIGKIGAIRRELDGKACLFCEGQTYQLVLRG